jgi:hypothetical protein
MMHGKSNIKYIVDDAAAVTENNVDPCLKMERIVIICFIY